MKNNSHYTEIAFVLDRSGSMSDCQQSAIDGFNRFLTEQQDARGLARLTLVLFDDEYLVPVRSLPVPEVLPLNRETYVPRNSTALLDAIGQTIDELGATLAAMVEKDRPARVIIAILTDGYENASQRYTWQDIAARIRHQSDVYRWTFLFLGANQDAIATAAQLNIGAGNAATFVADAAGSRASLRAISRKAKGIRMESLGVATVEELHDFAAPMSAILKEEEESERGTPSDAE